MIYTNSKIKIIDNTGVQEIKCIKFYKYKLYKTSANVGDFFLASIQRLKVKKRYKLKKGMLLKALIVRLKRNIKRKSCGTLYLNSESNAAILLTNNLLPRGTRVKEPIYQEVRNGIFLKILSLARTVI